MECAAPEEKKNLGCLDVSGGHLLQRDGVGELQINISSSVCGDVKKRFEPAASLTDSGAQHMAKGLSRGSAGEGSLEGNPSGCGQLGTLIVNTRAS